MRILHVVTVMSRGGLETWLMQVFRNIDRDRFRFDFAVHKSEPGQYDEEIRSLGGRLLSLGPSRFNLKYPAYLRRFGELLEREGPYDVVHAHGGNLYGPLLRQAARAGVPMRIIHGHNLQKTGLHGPVRSLASWFGRRMLRRYETVGLGCSEAACAALFGRDWKSNSRYRALYYGIDLEPYRHRDREGVRRELGIGSDEFVIAHVGRFNPVKNHRFIVRICEQVAGLRPDARCVLIGDGAELENVKAQVEQAGLSGYVLFTGSRPDVPRLLSGMDAFVLPSFHEGLGLVVIEAQAAGLPCLVSDRVPRDTSVVPGMCRWMRLEEPPAAWAGALLKLAADMQTSPEQARLTVEQSRFNIRNSVAQLVSIYEQAGQGETSIG